MIEQQDDKPDWRRVIAGFCVSTFVALAGYYLLRNQRGEMGIALFFMTPVAAGVAAGLIAQSSRELILALTITFLGVTAALFISNAEGWVCILMSAPIIFFGLGIGAFLGRLVRKSILSKFRSSVMSRLIIIIILPVLLGGANWLERETSEFKRHETIVSTVLLDASGQAVWDSIKEVDRIDLPRPFLLRIGLPVPISCSIADERVGGARTCYFDSGYISERITEWNPPSSMRMDIVDAQVPGRQWLGFQSAGYTLQEQNGKTLLIRETTIESRLLPAWYWRRLERIGVETEHEYLFEYLRRHLPHSE